MALRSESPTPPKSKQIDLKDPRTYDFIQGARADYIHQRDRSLTEENETERALCGQLMLITTVLLSANFVVLGNGDLVTSSSPIQKVCMTTGVVLLTFSIAAGVKYYFRLISFHFDWAQASNEVVGLHSRVGYKDFDEAGRKTDQKFKGLKKKTPKKWLRKQIKLLGVGATVYLVLLVAILFDFRFITNHLPHWLR